MGPRKVMPLLIFCCGCLAIDEWKPFFKSTNFQNVLHWRKMDSFGEEVRYNVAYKRYGDQGFKQKLECQNITALYCDLTAETPYIYNVPYYIASVTASNGQCLGQTERFQPLKDTNFGAPTVIVTSTTSSINVTVTLPLGPDRITSIKEIFNSTSIKPSPTHFTLNITDPSWAAQVHENLAGEFVIKNLKNNNTEYCGYVFYKPTLELNGRPSKQQTFCVTLPGNPWQVYTWFLLSGSFLLCSLLLLLVVCFCYVKKTSNIPEALKWKESDVSHSLWPCPEAVTISVAKPDPVVSNDIGQSVRSGYPSYYHQTGPCMPKPWHCDNYMGQQTPPPGTSSSQFSTNYGVVVVQVNKEEAEQKCHLKGGVDISTPWSPVTNHQSDPKTSLCQRGPDLLSCAATLVPNHCLQDRDVPTLIQPMLGQLLLQPEVIASLADLERMPLFFHPDKTLQGPLLSLDMITTDGSEWLASDIGSKEEGTIYRPNAILSECEPSSDRPSSSGYKQHWVAPLGLSSEASFELSSYAPQESCLKQQDEGDIEKGEGRSREIYLGGWVVEIQG